MKNLLIFIYAFVIYWYFGVCRNLCGCEKYPMLRTINRVLRNYPGPGPDCSLGTQPLSQLKQIVGVPSVCSQAEKHESDGEKFYACQSGLRVEQQCPPGLHFSEVIVSLMIIILLIFKIIKT